MSDGTQDAKPYRLAAQHVKTGHTIRGGYNFTQLKIAADAARGLMDRQGAKYKTWVEDRAGEQVTP